MPVHTSHPRWPTPFTYLRSPGLPYFPAVSRYTQDDRHARSEYASDPAPHIPHCVSLPKPGVPTQYQHCHHQALCHVSVPGPLCFPSHENYSKTLVLSVTDIKHLESIVGATCTGTWFSRYNSLGRFSSWLGPSSILSVCLILRLTTTRCTHKVSALSLRSTTLC